MSQFAWLQLPTFTNLRGPLTVLENALPFQVVLTDLSVYALEPYRGSNMPCKP